MLNGIIENTPMRDGTFDTPSRKIKCITTFGRCNTSIPFTSSDFREIAPQFVTEGEAAKPHAAVAAITTTATSMATSDPDKELQSHQILVNRMFQWNDNSNLQEKVSVFTCGAGR